MIVQPNFLVFFLSEAMQRGTLEYHAVKLQPSCSISMSKKAT